MVTHFFGIHLFLETITGSSVMCKFDRMKEPESISSLLGENKNKFLSIFMAINKLVSTC